jgi:hypothetical protein
LLTLAFVDWAMRFASIDRALKSLARDQRSEGGARGCLT